MVLLTINTSSHADIPKTLNYQGRLMVNENHPVADKDCSVTFRLYTTPVAGNILWQEAQIVTTKNGYFNAVLGNITSLNMGDFNQSLWIGVQMETGAEMTPRQQLGTAAYAIGVADNVITTDKLKDNAITSNKIKDGGIEENDIADKAVTLSKMKLGYAKKAIDFEPDVEIAGNTGDKHIPELDLKIEVESDSILQILFYGSVTHSKTLQGISFKIKLDETWIETDPVFFQYEGYATSGDGPNSVIPMMTLQEVSAGQHNISIYVWAQGNDNLAKVVYAELSVIAFGGNDMEVKD